MFNLTELLQKFWFWLRGEIYPPLPQLPPPKPTEQFETSPPPDIFEPIYSPEYRFIVVQARDSLFSLASTHGISVRTIIHANHLKTPNQIYIGQRIRIAVPQSPWIPPDFPLPDFTLKAKTPLPAQTIGSEKSLISDRDSTLMSPESDEADEIVTQPKISEEEVLADVLPSLPPAKMIILPGITLIPPRSPESAIESRIQDEQSDEEPQPPSETLKLPEHAEPEEKRIHKTERVFSVRPEQVNQEAKQDDEGSDADIAVQDEEAIESKLFDRSTQQEIKANHIKHPPDLSDYVSKDDSVTIKVDTSSPKQNIPPIQPEAYFEARLPYPLATKPVVPQPPPSKTTRALYIPYHLLGSRQKRARITQLIQTTDLNALVLDIKSDTGHLSYPSQVPLTAKIAAHRPTVDDIIQTIARLKANQVYIIARLVAFKDNLFAQAHPDLAARDRQTGTPWFDDHGFAWLDPFQMDVWGYILQIVEEVAHFGFDEIHLDCLRFPLNGQQLAPQFCKPVQTTIRSKVIAAFLSAAKGTLSAFNVKLSATVRGYACWRTDDALVGQQIETLAPYLDYLCPILYPSLFPQNTPSLSDPKAASDRPYEILYQGTYLVTQRLKNSACAVRPWLQDFPSSQLNRQTLATSALAAQIQGTFDGGGQGFMAWDAAVQYSDGVY